MDTCLLLEHCRVDLSLGHVLRSDGPPHFLTPRELAVLQQLVRGGGDPIERNQLFVEAFEGAAQGSRALDMCVANLRQKLGPDRGVVQTVRGRGYAYVGPTAEVWSPGDVGESASLGTVHIDWQTNTIQARDKRVTLSGLEAKVLRVLADHSPLGLSTQDLATRVWRSSTAQGSVRVCIRRLRRKLEAAQAADVLVTSSDGYRLVLENDQTVWVAVARLPEVMVWMAQERHDAIESAWSVLREGLTPSEQQTLSADRLLVVLQQDPAPWLERASTVAAIGLSQGAVQVGPLGWRGRAVAEAMSLADVAPLGTVLSTRNGLGPDWRLVGPVPTALGFIEAACLGVLGHPVSQATLVGREADLAQVHAALEEHPWVTLVGPGGVGKTSLARKALPTAVLVDLSDVCDHEGVLLAVHRGLGLAASAEANIECIRLAMTANPNPLLLDNCEQLAPGSLSSLQRLSEQGVVRVLATSRERCGGVEHIVTLDPLSADDAHTLLEQRIQRSFSDDEVGALLAFLDGLPLAIELAAEGLRTRTPTELCTMLEGSLMPLRNRKADSARHATMTAAIRWSWDDMSLEEQQVLASCSVFVGGWRHAEAEAVTLDQDGAHLEALVDRSLVQWTPNETGSRFSMFYAVRVFAMERLRESGLETEVRVRHAAAYAALATPLLNQLHDNRRNGQSLKDDRGNLQAAADSNDLEVAATCALGLAQVLLQLGPTRRGVPLLERHLQAPVRLRMAIHITLSQLFLRVQQSERAIEQATTALLFDGPSSWWYSASGVGSGAVGGR